MQKFLKVIVILAIVGILAGLFVYKFVYNKPHPDYEKVKPQFTLTAEELFKAYKTGESFSVNYNGSVVQLQCTVTRVESHDSLVIAVMVFDKGPFGEEGIRCDMLQEYHEQTRELIPGQALTIKGLCTGYNDTDVILEKCSIVK